MNSPPAHHRHSSIFTLGSALRWLGHDCPDRRCCSAPIDVMEASVWFLKRGRRIPTYPFSARVVVSDPAGTQDGLPHIQGLIDRVNACAGRDAIEVHLRPRRAVEPVGRRAAESRWRS